MKKKIQTYISRVRVPTKKKRYRVAITGLSRAGKTVFITSLIDQLLYRDKIPFLMDKKSFRAKLLPPSLKQKRFDYYSIAKEIKNNHTWPEGTSEITSTTIEIERKNPSIFRHSEFELEIIDYPGEWLLDLSLLEMSFMEWSSEVLSWLESLEDEDASSYIKLLNEKNIDSKMITDSYKKLLVRLREKEFTNLSPGRFIMPSDLENDPMLDFAPVDGMSLFKDEFEKNYKKYVDEILKNIHLEHFKDFDRQIVLVDVIKALQNGYKCYKDMKVGLQKVVSLYDHKKHSFLKKLFTPTISKVVFAAPKCDLLSSSQHQNYKALLGEMTKSYKEDLAYNKIKSSSHIFASIKCTETIQRKHEGMLLSYIRGKSIKTKTLQDHYPGEIPPVFPSACAWNVEDYNYLEVMPPEKEYRDDEALDHINMDEIIDALIGDLL